MSQVHVQYVRCSGASKGFESEAPSQKQLCTPRLHQPQPTAHHREPGKVRGRSSFPFTLPINPFPDARFVCFPLKVTALTDCINQTAPARPSLRGDLAREKKSMRNKPVSLRWELAMSPAAREHRRLHFTPVSRAILNESVAHPHRDNSVASQFMPCLGKGA